MRRGLIIGFYQLVMGTIIIIMVYMLITVSNKLIIATENINHLEDDINLYEYYTKSLNSEITELETQLADTTMITNKLQTIETENKELKDTLDRYKEVLPKGILSRGSRPKPITMEVTAYDLSYASCQKYPSDKGYGITSSGNKVNEWDTVAAGSNIPFGTKLYIPFFADKPNAGIFTVSDRGGAITTRRLDIFMESRSDALEFGRRELEVFVLD